MMLPLQLLPLPQSTLLHCCIFRLQVCVFVVVSYSMRYNDIVIRDAIHVVSPVIVVALLLHRRATANAKSVDVLQAQWDTSAK